MKFVSCLGLLGIFAALPAGAADYWEFEPNNEFPPSFLPGNPLFLSGDRLLGHRKPGELDRQYIRFAGTGAPGIYRYDVNMVEGGDGYLALFDASDTGYNLSINDDHPSNADGRPRLFFDHFDRTGAETVWGIEVDGFIRTFSYAVEFRRDPVVIASLGMVGANSVVGTGEVAAGQAVWFSFATSSKGVVTIQTSGDFDTEIALFDGHGETIHANDDHEFDPLARIETILPGGTYYVAVGGFKSIYDWDSFSGRPLGWDRDGFGSLTEGYFRGFEKGPVGLRVGFVATTPEPGALAMLAASAAAVAAGWRRRRQK